MATKRRNEEKRVERPNPFTDPNFRSRDLTFGDMAFRRRFEQNLIRFGVIPQVAPASSGQASGGVALPTASQDPDLPYDGNQVYTGSGEWEEMVSSSGLAVRLGCATSSTTRNENYDERSTSVDAYEVIKAIRINEPVKGVLRVSYAAKTSDALVAAFARLLVNGVAIGTELETNSEAGETQDEQFTVDWAIGDLVQVAAYSEGGGAIAYVYDMAIKYNCAIIGFGSWNLATGLPTVEQTPFSMSNVDP